MHVQLKKNKQEKTEKVNQKHLNRFVLLFDCMLVQFIEIESHLNLVKKKHI